MQQKRASSAAAWAVLTSGVADARVESHRLRHLLGRAQKILADLDPELVAEKAGDLLKAIPEIHDRLDMELDSTSYALSLMGQEFLRNRITVDNRREVEQAIEGVSTTPPQTKQSFQKHHKQRPVDKTESRNYYRRNKLKIKTKAKKRYLKQKINPQYQKYRDQYRKAPVRFHLRSAAEMFPILWEPRGMLFRVDHTGSQDGRVSLISQSGERAHASIDVFFQGAVYLDSEQMDHDFEWFDQFYDGQD